MLLQGNLDRGPANSFPTMPPSSNGDGAGSKPPGSAAKRQSSVPPRCSRGPSCSPRSRPVCPFLMPSRSGTDPSPFPSLESGTSGGSQQVWIRLRSGATKIPPWHECTTRLPPPCCQPCHSDPPLYSPSLETSWRPPALRTVPGQEGAGGRGNRGRRRCSCLQGEQPRPLRCLAGGFSPLGAPQLLGGAGTRCSLAERNP